MQERVFSCVMHLSVSAIFLFWSKRTLVVVRSIARQFAFFFPRFIFLGLNFFRVKSRPHFCGTVDGVDDRR